MRIIIETDDRDVFEHLLYMLGFYKRVRVKVEENEDKEVWSLRFTKTSVGSMFISPIMANKSFTLNQ